MTAPSTGAVVLRCPVHGIPDCSPLLNGCSIPNAVRALIAEAVQAERERIAVEFEEMGDVWGGDVPWLTTGNRIAALAADVARDGGR